MVTLRIKDGEEVRKVDFPDTWDDLTVDQFQQILEWEPSTPIEKRDRVTLFSILTGVSYQSIFHTKDYELEGKLSALTAFVFADPPFYSAPIPRTVKAGNRNIKIPENIGDLTVGASVHVRQACLGLPDARVKMSLVLSVYLQPFWNGKDQPDLFDLDKALSLEPLVKRMKIRDVYPIGYFFLTRLSGSGESWWTLLNRRIQWIAENALRSLKWRRPKSLTGFLSYR